MLEIFKTIRYVNRNTFSPRHLANRIKVMDEYIKGKLLVESFPNMIHIEPTNHCNLRCIMCPQPTVMTRSKGYMDFDLYTRIIDELKNTPAEFIYLHQFGESLLHRRFFDMVRYAKESGIQVGFSTNATLLTEENSQELLKSGLDFTTLSLDGGNAELYRTFRLGADWNKVEQNCINFLEMRKEQNKEKQMHVVAQTISMKGNENSVQNLYNRFKKYKISFTNKPFNEWGGKVDDIKNLSTNIDPAAGAGRIRCEKPYKLLTVEWDGTVVPCTRFFDNQYIYGTFPQNSLREIWNGTAVADFRKSHLGDRGSIDYCSTCICDGPSFIERQALKAMDILLIEKFIMDVPFIRNRGVANLTEKLIHEKEGEKFQ